MTIAADAQILFTPAWQQRELLRRGQVSGRELMSAHLEQIELANPSVNAIVTMVDGDELLDQAEASDTRRAAAPDSVGLLHGLPVGIKDLQPTAGLRTTYGSRIHADWVPDIDSMPVRRYKSAGAIVVGKTNTPEFGAGSQTFNEVFGATLNPYDTGKTCGGSSGGAAVALACGMLPIAQGSDFGGSLRNPAAWSNVVGMRNSIGVVPASRPLGYTHESVVGAMGRTVKDVQLQLRAIAGHDPSVPYSLPRGSVELSGDLDVDLSGKRIAWSRDLGGATIDPEITNTLDKQREVFDELGCIVEDANPPLDGAGGIFHTVRAALFAHQHRDDLDDNRAMLKETIVWNAEAGLALSAMDLKLAEEHRTALFERVATFMSKYDYIAAPVTSIPPFNIDMEYPTVVAGVKMSDYLEWMSPCTWITVTGLPAISVPAGFHASGLPCGLQLIGRRYADMSVLQLAHAFEQATNFWKRAPELALPIGSI